MKLGWTLKWPQEVIGIKLRCNIGVEDPTKTKQPS